MVVVLMHMRLSVLLSGVDTRLSPSRSRRSAQLPARQGCLSLRLGLCHHFLMVSVLPLVLALWLCLSVLPTRTLCCFVRAGVILGCPSVRSTCVSRRFYLMILTLSSFVVGMCLILEF